VALTTDNFPKFVSPGAISALVVQRAVQSSHILDIEGENDLIDLGLESLQLGEIAKPQDGPFGTMKGLEEDLIQFD